MKRSGPGHAFLAMCVIMSAVFHAGALLMLDFRPSITERPPAVLTVDLLKPAPPEVVRKPVPEPAPPEKVEPRPEPVRKVAGPPPEPKTESRAVRTKPAAPLKKRSAKASKTETPPVVASKPEPAAAKPAPQASAKASATAIPVGRLEERPGVTVLANESGEDTLKHGAEARFMHGVATEEFVEENYVGEYRMFDSSRVWIEDDRARSGHLILHAEAMGFHRKLFRFNRFIYVYGETPEDPMPVLGSVTFFSDGYHIHQFLWQHNATEAFYPRRN